MNVPNNKRKKESIDRMEKAFINILQNKDLDNISVSEICKKADLNRTTFYANYDSIYDLADSIRDKLESDMKEIYKNEIDSKCNSNDYLKLFRHIKDNQIFYRTYFKLGYDNNYKIVWYDKTLAEKYFGNRFIEYHMEFFRGGITRIIKMWLEKGCKESPEEMNEILISEYQGKANQPN